MKRTDIPARLNIPFAANAGAGYIRTVPQASQQGIQDGAASLNDGFPPLNFLPVGAGGVPPFGQDMNGILSVMSGWDRWYSAGGPQPYDHTFAVACGGYPEGAMIPSAVTLGLFWISTADDNQTDPDNGGTNWMAFPGSVTRSKLLANLTLYVNPSTGSDAYDGSQPTVSGTKGPFATLNHAYAVAKTRDLNGYTLTFSCAAAGTYATLDAYGPIPGQNGPLDVRFTAESGITLQQTGTSGYAIRSRGGAMISVGGPWTFQCPNINSAGGGACLRAETGGQLQLATTGMAFGAAGLGSHLDASQSGIIITGPSYTINNISFGRHLLASSGQIYSAGGGGVITLVGTPAASQAFAEAQGGLAYIGMLGYSFSGAGTGTRYALVAQAWINTYGSPTDPDYFPGNAAGGGTGTYT